MKEQNIRGRHKYVEYNKSNSDLQMTPKYKKNIKGQKKKIQ